MTSSFVSDANREPIRRHGGVLGSVQNVNLAPLPISALIDGNAELGLP